MSKVLGWDDPYSNLLTEQRRVDSLRLGGTGYKHTAIRSLAKSIFSLPVNGGALFGHALSSLFTCEKNAFLSLGYTIRNLFITAVNCLLLGNLDVLIDYKQLKKNDLKSALIQFALTLDANITYSSFDIKIKNETYDRVKDCVLQLDYCGSVVHLLQMSPGEIEEVKEELIQAVGKEYRDYLNAASALLIRLGQDNFKLYNQICVKEGWSVAGSNR